MKIKTKSKIKLKNKNISKTHFPMNSYNISYR